MDQTIVDRALAFAKYKGITSADFERVSGLANGMLKKLSERTRFQTFNRISNAFPELNIEWLRTGVGEMTNNNNGMSQNGNGDNRQQGRAGHNLTQNNNSEKLIENFINVVHGQNLLVEKTIEQTGKAIDGMRNALEEIAEQRKQTDSVLELLKTSLNLNK